MAKNLIIVESPAKTRTLRKFLGRDWAVEASVGHIRDLPKKDMGLGVDFEPKYAVLADKKDVVKRLREAAKKAQTVYLAPDPDREGEAIAWHIAEVLDSAGKEVHRVTFNEITKRAVLQALAEPGVIDQRKVDAQQARRVLDRLMGFKLSPLLWDKVKRGLSAGRVQSVALKMVCERQDEIEAFVPVEYWVLGAELAAGTPPTFLARLHQIKGKKAEVGDAATAGKVAAAFEKGPFKVTAIERKESKQRPSPPFITSRLQQEAARRYGFSVKRTMALAQGLYEGREIGDRGQLGLITYMRTDSTRIADEAIVAVREAIAATYGADKLPEKPNFYSSKKGAQDAHEAIRPTYFDLPPESVAGYLSADELKLYRLIWDRFVASQMLPAIFDVTRVDVGCGPYTLRATGKVLKSAGFLAVYREVEEGNGDGEEGGKGEAKEDAKEDAMLPALVEGQELRLVRVEKEQKFTQPPAQYSEATLVKALEENGIGRPSTYASILSTLTDREYVAKVEARFRPSPLGRLVNKLLQGGFADVLNERYTAQLEEELDKIEEGGMPWKQAVREFDEKFDRDLATAGEKMPNVKRDGLPTDESCPKCGAPLVVRFGRYGAFVGCSNYRAEPPCDYTRDLEPKAESEAPAEEIAPCEKCGKPMAMRRSRFGVFLGCTGYPECKNIRKTGPKAEPPKETGVGCPQCNEGTMLEKKSRRGKIFFSCSRYPACDFALWDRPVPQPCPRCGAPYLVEKTSKRKGSRLICTREGCGYEEEIAEAS
ncbi:MAG: type I DNA topoisomerase [Holophagales bacterium]|nr:MAG: type I DNA topoisomerase [Holophagales bacterium]